MKNLFNKSGQTQLWEVVLLLFLFCGIFAYMDFKRTTSTNNISAGAAQLITDTRNTGLIGNFAPSLMNFGSCSKNCTPPQSKDTTPVVILPVQPAVVVPQQTTEINLTFGENKVKIKELPPLERIFLSLIIVLAVISVGGLMDALGGDHWLFCRRYIMPLAVVAPGVSFITWIFNPVWYSWLIGICIWPVCATLTLPYSGDGNFGRALWLWLNSVVMGLFLVIVSYLFGTHYLTWYFYVWYTITTGILGGFYKNWQQFDGDWITGAQLCSVILYEYLTLLFHL